MTDLTQRIAREMQIRREAEVITRKTLDFSTALMQSTELLAGRHAHCQGMTPGTLAFAIAMVAHHVASARASTLMLEQLADAVGDDVLKQIRGIVEAAIQLTPKVEKKPLVEGPQ